MTRTLSIHEPPSRHARLLRGKDDHPPTVVGTKPHPRSMAELARQIIRQQWPNRHHPDPVRRTQARTLIRTHAFMLRQWRLESESVA